MGASQAPLSVRPLCPSAPEYGRRWSPAATPTSAASEACTTESPHVSWGHEERMRCREP